MKPPGPVLEQLLVTSPDDGESGVQSREISRSRDACRCKGPFVVESVVESSRGDGINSEITGGGLCTTRNSREI